jgi:hypothetical protein
MPHPIIPGFPGPATCNEYWREAVRRREAHDRSWIPCTEEFYMEMLTILPPRYPKVGHETPLGWCFANSEPYDHDSRGEEVLLCFRDSPFACRMTTMRDFNAEIAAAQPAEPPNSQLLTPNS